MTKDSDLQVLSKSTANTRMYWTHREWDKFSSSNKNNCCRRNCRCPANLDDQSPWSPDVLTTLAAAAIKTSIVRLGTAIIPTYPRHPVVLAQEVLALHDIAPGRLRLGIGPSHRAIVEDIYGLPQTTPLVHLREYVKVLHSILGWEGRSSWRIL